MVKPLLLLVASACVVAFAACSANAPTAAPVHRAIGIVARDVRFVPEASVSTKDALRSEIDTTLDRLYTHAFIRPDAVGPTPAPTAIDTETAIAYLVAPGARASIGNAFDLGPDLEVKYGRVDWDGVVTHGSGKTTAYITVDFKGSVSRIDGTDTILVAHQDGTILLDKIAGRLFVRGFDLHLKTVPAPTPSPT